MEFFITLVNGWKPPTNASNVFILNIAKVLLDIYEATIGINKKPIKTDLFFFDIGLISTFNKRDFQ